MSEKRVKIGKEFEHIPAVKSGRGWLGLEKGKFGRVRFESRSRKLELWIKQGSEWKRTQLRFYGSWIIDVRRCIYRITGNS